MNIAQYLDSTYLKTPEQAGISEEQTLEKVMQLTDEAIAHDFYAVMIRPQYVAEVKSYLKTKNAKPLVGTVIGFHEGTASTEDKLKEAQKALQDGADELDFVINFEAYKKGEIEAVKNEFVKGSALVLEAGKVVKWIIETAALTSEQIADITSKIASWAGESFDAELLPKIFVKSSTGFYKTEDGKPNGATFQGIQIMLDNAGRLSVKASGGVKTPEDAKKMIEMGVKRIGTSSALALTKNEEVNGY